MSWFYEIRSSTNTVLKSDGGFHTQDAAKIAGRQDAKKMQNLRQPGRADVGRIMGGQNAERATRRVADPLSAAEEKDGGLGFSSARERFGLRGRDGAKPVQDSEI